MKNIWLWVKAGFLAMMLLGCGGGADGDVALSSEVALPPMGTSKMAQSARSVYYGARSINVQTTGAGTVTGTPGGIKCGNGAKTCSATFYMWTEVILTATPAPNMKFLGWGGVCSGTNLKCVLNNAQPRLATAKFSSTSIPSYGLTLSVPASGSVSSVPAGIQCGGDCAETYTAGANVTLVATPSAGYALSSWGGACSGNSASCTVAMSAARNVTATFAATGGGSGTAGASSNASFSFLAYGDSRSGNGCDGNAVHMKLVQKMVAEPASFVFNLGDMVTGYDKSTNWVQRGDCQADAQRGSFKEIIAPLQNKTPAAGLPTFYFPVLGNHDDNFGDGWYPDKFGHGFCDVFNPKLLVPNHTQNKAYFADWISANVKHYSDAEFYPLACAKTRSGVYPDYMYYSFDYKNSHFIVLRLNSDYQDLTECYGGCTDGNNYDRFYNKHQLDWLRWDLAQTAAKISIQNVFVLAHAPLVSYSDGHAPNSSWPTLLKEFSKYKAKVVFSGHSHVYERSHPVYASDTYPAGVRDDAKGTVYTVTGGGGSALHGFRSIGPLNAKASAAHHYLRVDVNGNTVSVKAIGVDGTVIDSFSR